MVHIIGIGADGPASLTPRALRLVAEAEVLAGGERHLAFFPEHPAERVVIRANLAEVAERLAGCLERRTVVLASGDPNFYGIARYLLSRIPRDRVEIIPNVSAMQLAFARVKLPWDDAALGSVHGRPIGDVVELVRRNDKVGLFTGGRHGPAEVARALLAHGIADRRAYVCEDLGTPRERVTAMDLARLAEAECSPLNVLILVREGRDGAGREGDGGPEGSGRPEGGGEPVLGIPDDSFLQRRPRRGLITKAEVRAVSLAKLALRPGMVLWDVGAGTGSVGIEAARLVPGSRVYAIEKEEADAENLRRNAARFAPGRVTAVHGMAPEGLDAFPDPDAVFIGGTGGRMEAILDVVRRRLRPGGRVVLNLATLEHLAAADAILRRFGWEREVVMVQVARSRALAAGREVLTRLESLDPVFILSAWPPQAGRAGEGDGGSAFEEGEQGDG